MAVVRPSKRRRLSVLPALLAAFACRPAPPAPDAVATSELGEIRRAELDEHILSLPEERRAPPAETPLPEWRREILEELLVSRALLAEARSQGLAERPDNRELLDSRRAAILVREMSARLIEEKVEVTEEDLRAFYDAHAEEFSHPEQIRVRNIFRRVARDAPQEDWEAKRQEVEGLLDQVRRGARFGDLARAHSDSETASLEGLIGRLDHGQLDPALEEILWSLDEGEVSEVIRTPVGFHLFKVEDQIGRFKMDFEDARTRLRRRLTREATEAAEETILQELVEASGATFAPEVWNGGDDEAVLFALDDESLTVADFRERLHSLGFATAREASPRSQLDQAVRERLYLWRARRDGLAEEPEVAARLEQDEREALISLARRERAQAMVREIDEKALRDFYASREERYRTPRLLHLRILTRNFPEDGSWYAVYEELEQLAEEIRAGRRDFAEAARQLSTDFSAARGGDVGGIRADAFAEWAGPQAQNKILALAAGEVSEPLLIERYNNHRMIYDRAGYMLVKLESIEGSRKRPLEEVRERVIEQYVQQGGEAHQRLREQILSSVDAEIFSENL